MTVTEAYGTKPTERELNDRSTAVWVCWHQDSDRV